jgi:class 3 adenylate cyclase
MMPPTPMPAPSTKVAIRLIAHAAILGEKGVAVTRLVLSGLMVPSTLIFHGRAGPLFRQPEIIMAMVGYTVGIIFSVWTILTLRRQHHLLWRLRISVMVDAAMVALIILPLHIWTTATYEGFLRSPNAGILAVATLATGLRISRSVALLGSGLFLMIQAATITVDLTLNAGHVTVGVDHVINAAVYSVGAVILAYTMAVWSRKLIYRAAAAEHQAERLRQSYDLLIAGQQNRELSVEPTALSDGQRKTAGLIVCTVSGFKMRTGEIPAGQMIAEMNVYFDAMAAVVKKHGGIVDKFFGETMVSLFGLPKPRPDDALRTVRAALEMQQALIDINSHRKKAMVPILGHTVAVHFGDVTVGSIGSRGRRQYSIAGAVLSAAMRLAARAEDLGVPMLVSAVAYKAAHVIDSRIPLVEIKNVETTDVGSGVYGFGQLGGEDSITEKRTPWSST